MSRLRRMRRKQRPLVVLAMVSLLGFFFPHPAAASANQEQNQIIVVVDKGKIFSQGNVTPTPEMSSPKLTPTSPPQTSAITLPVIPPFSRLTSPTTTRQSTKQAKRVFHVVATAYTSSVDETDSDPFTTASGAKTGDGVIAANGFKFGTKVRLPDVYGDKEYVVLDRMNPRYGKHHIDIWMPSKQLAKEWGVRTVLMEIQ